MSDKGSGGGLLSELPLDRLRTEVTELGKAMAKNGLSSAVEKAGDGGGATGKAAGKAAGALKEGTSPVKAVTEAGGSAVKDKVTDAVKGAIPGLGGGKKMKVVNILETIEVPVPRRVAYDKWTQFQDIPDFTRKVEKVEQQEDEKVEWKAQVFLSHRTWQATIKEQVPDERIVWESSGEKGHVDGAVTFHELAPDLTRILMTLEYHPQGFFEKTANLWRAQGRRARADMRQFRREMTMHTMLEQDEQEGWRGKIEESEVVQDDAEARREERSSNGSGSKSTGKKSAAKKSTSKKSSSPAKKTSSKKSTSSPAKKSAARKSSSTRKSAAKKSSSPAKKSTAKKSTSKRAAKKSSRSSS
ncbi:MAG: SRPBCC family protein [Nocardioides sp.]